MSEHQGLIDAGMAVLDDFMSALNASDEAGVNRSFNFPHVRFTGGGEVKIFAEPVDYKLSYFRERTEADIPRWLPNSAHLVAEQAPFWNHERPSRPLD